MRTGRFKATVGVVLATLAFPVLILFVPLNHAFSAEAPAPCHQEKPSPDAPMGSHHDCCLVGHNHPFPAQTVSSPAPQNVALVERAPIAFLVRFGVRPEPALTSFDPPGPELPLRL